MLQDKETRKLSGVWKEDESLSFEITEKKPKTNVFIVLSKCSEIELGRVKWYPSWRHYCFFPTIETETVYSDRCLISIGEFLSDLNREYKQKLKGDKK